MSDPRDELRRRLDADELSDADADRALAELDRDREREADLAALRAAEQPGTMSWEESRAVVDSWNLDEQVVLDMMRRLGLETSAR